MDLRRAWLVAAIAVAGCEQVPAPRKRDAPSVATTAPITAPSNAARPPAGTPPIANPAAPPNGVPTATPPDTVGPNTPAPSPAGMGAVAPVAHSAPRCVPLPAHRPDELAITVSHSGFYPNAGRQYGSVQLISHRGSCTEQPCWTVEDTRFDRIYKQLRDHGCLLIASHRPPARPLRPQYSDEHWLAATWKGGACTVEQSDARVVADGDRDKLTACLDIVGVSFGRDGRPDAMR